MGAGNSESDELSISPDKIRAEYHESSGDEAKITEFKKKYFLVDIAEEHWSKIWTDEPPSKSFFTSTQDVPLSSYQTSLAFALYPLNFRLWTELFSDYVKNCFNHPYDALHEFIKSLPFVLFPLLASFFLTLFIYFIVWAVPVARDIPKWIGSNSRFVSLSSLLVLTMLTIYSRQWNVTCFIFSLLLIPYSREKSDGIFFSMIFGAILSLNPISTAIENSLSGLSAIEAMEKGRTRLEYSIEDFQSMGLLDQALWEDLNLETTSARTLSAKLPPSVEKEIITINFDEESSTTQNLIERYESLRERIGDEPRVLFNLSQLLTKSQQLVSADKLREKIPAETLRAMTRQSSKLNRLLLPPSPSSPSELARTKGRSMLKKIFETYGIYPLKFEVFYKYIFQFLIPWLLILFALFWRKRASGLCIHTGEATLASDIDSSSLYQAASQKDETTNHALRVQVENLVRKHQHQQKKLIQRLCWLHPGVSSLYSNSSIVLPWLKALLVYGLLWNAISPLWRIRILEFCGFSPESTWAHSHFSLGFGVVFFLCYGLFVIRETRRASA